MRRFVLVLSLLLATPATAAEGDLYVAGSASFETAVVTVLGGGLRAEVGWWISPSLVGAVRVHGAVVPYDLEPSRRGALYVDAGFVLQHRSGGLDESSWVAGGSLGVLMGVVGFGGEGSVMLLPLLGLEAGVSSPLGDGLALTTTIMLQAPMFAGFALGLAY